MASEPTINGQNITHSNSSHIRQAGPLGGQSWIMTVTNGSGGGDSYLKVKPLDSSLIGATMNISIKLYKVSAFSSLQVRYIKEGYCRWNNSKERVIYLKQYVSVRLSPLLYFYPTPSEVLTAYNS